MGKSVSFVHINKMSLDELINPDYFNIYIEEINALQLQLIQLNSNLFILKKIQNFPFDLFGEHPNFFWNIVYNGLFEGSVMVIWRLTDKDEKALALFSLKNNISKNLSQKNGFDLTICDQNGHKYIEIDKTT